MERQLKKLKILSIEALASDKSLFEVLEICNHLHNDFCFKDKYEIYKLLQVTLGKEITNKIFVTRSDIGTDAMFEHCKALSTGICFTYSYEHCCPQTLPLKINPSVYSKDIIVDGIQPKHDTKLFTFVINPGSYLSYARTYHVLFSSDSDYPMFLISSLMKDIENFGTHKYYDQLMPNFEQSKRSNIHYIREIITIGCIEFYCGEQKLEHKLNINISITKSMDDLLYRCIVAMLSLLTKEDKVDKLLARYQNKDGVQLFNLLLHKNNFSFENKNEIDIELDELHEEERRKDIITQNDIIAFRKGTINGIAYRCVLDKDLFVYYIRGKYRSKNQHEFIIHSLMPDFGTQMLLFSYKQIDLLMSDGAGYYKPRIDSIINPTSYFYMWNKSITLEDLYDQFYRELWYTIKAEYDPTQGSPIVVIECNKNEITLNVTDDIKPLFMQFFEEDNIKKYYKFNIMYSFIDDESCVDNGVTIHEAEFHIATFIDLKI